MNEYEFKSLRELPLELFEKAGKLGYAENAPVLTIIPDEIEPPEPPVTPTDIPLTESYRRKYLTQVTYPRLVCYPQNELIDRVAFRPEDAGGDKRDVEAIARRQQFYKLTSFNGEKFKFGYLCTVHYGPWSAIVNEEGPCIEGMPPRWELLAVPFPNVVLTWYGTWDDIPSYPNLHVMKGDLHLTGEEYFCCPGYRWCYKTQSCIPEQIAVDPEFDCDNISPV